MRPTLARILPLDAAASLRAAAATVSPEGDPGARQRAIEHATQRVRDLYPQCFVPEPEPEPEPEPDIPDVPGTPPDEPEPPDTPEWSCPYKS